MGKGAKENGSQGLQKFKGKPLPTGILETSRKSIGSQGLQECQGNPQGEILEAKASKSSRGSLREKYWKPRPPGVPGEASREKLEAKASRDSEGSLRAKILEAKASRSSRGSFREKYL